jgi:plastocyanin
MHTRFSHRRRGWIAATSALAVTAGIAVVSAAGAAQETKISIFDPIGGETCFTMSPGTCSGPIDVKIHTGDTVRWDFDGAKQPHNVRSALTDASTPKDSAWDDDFKRDYHFPPGQGSETYTFGKAGVYRFVCEVHANVMYGTITVEGEEVETPTPSATATATPTLAPTTSPTPAPTRSADDHLSTPAPGHGAKDTTAPSLQRASAKKVSGGARLRFWVSEPATITVKAVRKGSKKATVSTVVQAPQGTRSFVLRSKRFKRGTYAVTLAPVDAMGNKGTAATATLKVK